MAWDFCKLKSAGLHLHIRKKKQIGQSDDVSFQKKKKNRKIVMHCMWSVSIATRSELQLNF
jgi:hypothetical protein